MLADNISRNAAFLRDGVTSRVIAPYVAVAWADALIAEHDELPSPVYDLSVAARQRSMPVLDALGRLTAVPEFTDSSARALLDLIRARLAVGAVTVDDAVGMAYHLTRALSPESAIWTEAMCLEEDYSMAKDAISGSLTEMEAAIHAWFEQFRGSMSNFSVPAV